MTNRVNNPILSGFYPDPTICRVGDDYYLATSTFQYFPGVPIFHSTDLVHWNQIGNILDREEQIPLVNGDHSHGIFAPTLRYHNGTFYMITTNVYNTGNFIVTATDPKGPWSNPYVLDADGIDPSLFFDDDGKCYYCGTKPRREGARYYGDNEIYIQELDLTTMQLVGPSYPAWHGALRGVEWPEGPHIYKKDGWYYLLISEAGTAHDHAVSIARSKSLTEPFEGNRANPILTHRNLGRDYPIVNVGHPDIVETANGQWWMVLLASRTYGGYYRNLGRETYLTPFIWENGWPVINPGIGKLEDTVAIPNLPYQEPTPIPEVEDFNSTSLPLHFLYLRNPKFENYSLTQRPGYMSMNLAPEKLNGNISPSFLCQRQTSMSFIAETKVDFTPEDGELAGLTVYQSDHFHYLFGLTRIDNQNQLALIQCKKNVETILFAQPYSGDTSTLQLKIHAHLQDLQFSYRHENENSYTILAENVDARMLSTDVAGGFVGNCVGIFATSNGKATTNHADFDWIRYVKLDSN